MDVNGISAIRNYISSRPATGPSPEAGKAEEAGGFGAALGTAARDFAATLREAETTAVSALSGEGDTRSLVMALVRAELAVETAVTVRNKVVEAYQDILRMPV